MNVEIKNDNGEPIVFVGKTELNKEWYLHVKGERECFLLSLEDLERESNKKLSNCQYFVSAGHTGFKKKVIETIEQKVTNANFVTLIHSTASVSNDCTIGVGVSIGPFVYIGPNSVIGDHANFEIGVGLVHSGNKINKLVYIGPFSVVSKSNLANGTWLGAYAKLNTVKTAEYQQFKSHSRCSNKTFQKSGTYMHTRLQDLRNSLQLDITK